MYAIASASAASSGFGISVSLKRNVRAFWTCCLVACQFQHIHLLTCSGVYSMMGIHLLYNSRIITHLACATSIQVFRLLVKKSFSMAHASILQESRISFRSEHIWTSFIHNSSLGVVSMTQKLSISLLFQSFLISAKPVVVVPGSMPKIIDIYCILCFNKLIRNNNRL